MKKLISLITLAASLSAVPAQAQNAIESNPGYIDFSKYVSVSAEDSTVEVNLKAPLLRLAASIMEEENTEISQLIAGIQLVRVHVYEVDDENREQFTESVRKISETLRTKNWEQLVRVKDGDENVGVFANMPSEESIAGIVVSVSEDDEAVFVNIVGDVTLDSLAALGKHFDIPPLEKLSKKIKES